MAARPAGYNGRNITRLEHHFLIFLVYDAFICGQEYRAALHAFRAKRQHCRHAAPICRAACADDRNRYCVNNLRKQCHRSAFANVPAGLHALRDHRISTRALHALGKRRRRHDRHDLNARRLPGCHVFSRVARSSRQRFDLLINRQLCEVVSVRRKQHDVHTNRFIGHRPRLTDFLADIIDWSRAARNNPKPSRFADRCRERVVCNPGHRALDHRIFNA